MQFIPAKERYSHHAKTLNCELQLLHEAVLGYGHPSQEWQFQRLPGGFMNVNYLASADDQQVVVRVYSTDLDTAARERDVIECVAAHGVRVPRSLATLQVQDHPVAILEFVDGMTLEDRLLNGEPMAPTVFAEIAL